MLSHSFLMWFSFNHHATCHSFSQLSLMQSSVNLGCGSSSGPFTGSHPCSYTNHYLFLPHNSSLDNYTLPMLSTRGAEGPKPTFLRRQHRVGVGVVNNTCTNTHTHTCTSTHTICCCILFSFTDSSIVRSVKHHHPNFLPSSATS
jgi:hypothetical protein